MWNEYDIISQQEFVVFHQKKALKLRQFDIFQPEAIHQTLSDGLKTYILSLPSKVSLPRPFSIEITRAETSFLIIFKKKCSHKISLREENVQKGQ